MAFIKAQQLGFEMLDAAEFGEIQALLVQVEKACGNRDFALALQQGFIPGAFFKVGSLGCRACIPPGTCDPIVSAQHLGTCAG